MVMTARIYRATDDAFDAIWTGIDIYDPATQQSAITTFLDPDSCPEGSYLIANAMLQNHGQGWITVAMLEWRDGVRTVVIRDLGEDEVAISATDETVTQAIGAHLAKLLGGSANVFPSSDYRRSR